MIRAIGSALVAIAGLVSCASSPTPAQVAVAGAYEDRLGNCVFAAKALDASTPTKRAYADACMCDVAADAGQAGDPVLGCDGGSK